MKWDKASNDTQIVNKVDVAFGGKGFRPIILAGEASARLWLMPIVNINMLVSGGSLDTYRGTQCSS
jgi:hypothetical protein